LLQNDRAAAVAATIIAVPFLYLVTELAVLGTASGRLSVAMSNLSDANKSVRMDQSEAVRNLAAIQKYLALEPFPSQFEIFAAAARLLRNRQVSMSDWTYDNGNLEFAIKSNGQLDATYYIEVFEKDPIFTDVTATRDTQEAGLRLKMRVAPKVAS
jgi:hypothetical protein